MLGTSPRLSGWGRQGLALYAVMVGEGRPSTSLPALGSIFRCKSPVTGTLLRSRVELGPTVPGLPFQAVMAPVMACRAAGCTS